MVSTNSNKFIEMTAEEEMQLDGGSALVFASILLIEWVSYGSIILAKCAVDDLQNQ